MAGWARDLAITPILALSAFLQFYQLDSRQLFLGDQALHAQVAQDIALHGLRPLVGPPLAALSGTNMGPIFYYASAPAVWLSGGWPTGGAALVGLCQVCTVYLLYRVGRAARGASFGLAAAALYATSGVVVYWHRMLWPNMAPLCATLMLWALLALAGRSGGRRDGWALVALVGALTVIVQLQPTAFLLVPVAVGGWLLARPRRPAPWAIGGAAALGGALLSPLIINEATTGLSQTRAWLGYLRQTRPATMGGPRDALVIMAREYRGLLGLDNPALLAVLGGASVGALLWAARPRQRPEAAKAALLARLCLLWGGVYGVALALGHQQIYPHYFIPLFPLPFLALAYLLQPLWRRPPTAALAALAVVALAGWNTAAVWRNGFGLDRAALLDPADAQTPNLTLGTLRQITAAIASGVGAAPYNFELLSPADYPTDYKYLLRLQGARPSHEPVPRKALVVQPAYLPPAAWPGPVAAALAAATPRYWLFHHVALWTWQTGGPPLALPQRTAQGTVQGQEDGAHLVTALAFSGAGAVWSGSPLGVAVSPNGGLSWSGPHATRPGGADQLTALLPDPRRPGHGYAATISGVYTTADNGRTWSAALACRGRYFALLGPAPSLRLAGGEGGLCVSRDAGRTWRRQIVITSPATAAWETAHPWPIYALWQAPTGEVLAGSGGGLLVSPDGLAWRHVPGSPDVGITALLAAPGGSTAAWGTTGSPLLYIGTASGVLRTASGGRSWQRLDAGMGSPSIFALLTTPDPGGAAVWAATATGLYRLPPGETRWALVAGPWPRDAAALSLASGAGRLLVGTDGGLFRSLDGGHSWAASGP